MGQTNCPPNRQTYNQIESPDVNFVKLTLLVQLQNPFST